MKSNTYITESAVYVDRGDVECTFSLIPKGKRVKITEEDKGWYYVEPLNKRYPRGFVMAHTVKYLFRKED